MGAEIGEDAMPEATSDITWSPEDQTLSGWVTVDGKRVDICISRELVHSIPIYNDAIEQEIVKFKDDIVERLKPILLAKLREQKQW